MQQKEIDSEEREIKAESNENKKKRRKPQKPEEKGHNVAGQRANIELTIKTNRRCFPLSYMFGHESDNGVIGSAESAEVK